MYKKLLKILLIIILALIFLRAIFVIAGIGDEDKISGNKVAVINFEGEIFKSEPFIEKMQALVSNDNVKGIIIKVNSPGGAITPSLEIYEYLLTITKPVYVAMGSVAASGGYMISLGANKIFAMPTTVTGSIGVIMNMINTEELFKKIGIKSVVLKSGLYKDTGNPDRPMTEEEKTVLMAVVNDMYNQFVNIVAARRNMKIEDVKAVADGRILTGNMAKELSLVDNIGSYRDAFTDMSMSLNISGLEIYEVKEKQKLWDEILDNVGTLYNKSRSEIGIYYLMQ